MMDSTAIGISARSHDASRRLTFEAGLWAAVVGVAALLRLWTLNSAPLANPDASAALAGLAILRGETVPLTNPLYGTLLAVIFGIFGASDASARLVGCIAGIALCALPAVMRIDIGRVRALLFGALLAISPTLWFVSRQVDGALLAWVLGPRRLGRLAQRSCRDRVGTGRRAAGLRQRCGLSGFDAPRRPGNRR